ncbi:MAG: cytidine deaminase [Candidatus Velthaea sp.]
MITRDPSSILAAAVAARRSAYAPYSQFFVGAALMSRDGRLFTGANIENASYGLSMCAERVALFNAVSQGARAFDAIAVAGPDGVTTLPCGACRQALYEFAQQLRVIYPEQGQVKMTSLMSLLPEAFSAQTLNTNAPERGFR